MCIRCAEDAYIYVKYTPSLPALRQACSQNDSHATMGIDTSSAGAAAVAAVAFSPRLVLRAVADSLALGAASYTNKRSGLDAAFFFFLMHDICDRGETLQHTY